MMRDESLHRLRSDKGILTQSLLTLLETSPLVIKIWFEAHILTRITGKKIEETRFCFEKRKSLFKIHFFAFHIFIAFMVPRRGMEYK